MKRCQDFFLFSHFDIAVDNRETKTFIGQKQDEKAQYISFLSKNLIENGGELTVKKNKI
jgi:hypothetical protein